MSGWIFGAFEELLSERVGFWDYLPQFETVRFGVLYVSEAGICVVYVVYRIEQHLMQDGAFTRTEYSGR